MFFLQLILIVFLVVITLLLVALLIVRRITYKINKKYRTIFSSNERIYNDQKDTINDFYRKKQKINKDEGEYVDFEEIKL